MLLAVPEGVSVEPAEVLVKMEDENWWEASAKVTTCLLYTSRCV